jgi:predicted  nucleic acid-binding Zn-ribbon protein
MFADDRNPNQRRGRQGQFKSDYQQQLGEQGNQQSDGPLRTAAAQSIVGLPVRPQLWEPDERPPPARRDPPSADLQHLARQVQDLETSVQRLLAVDIPLRLKPHEDAFASLQSKYERSSHNARDAVQAIREKVTELSLGVSGMGQKVADLGDRQRSLSTELRAETVKAKDACEACSARLGQHDARLAQTDELLRKLSSRQEQLEQSLNDQFGLIAQAVGQLRSDLNGWKSEISGQVEAKNRETIATFDRMSQATTRLGDRLLALERDARESFAVLRKESDDEIEKVKQQLERTAAGVGESFSALQGEVVETFSSVRTALDAAVGSLQRALEDERVRRRDDDQKLLDANNVLTVKLGALSAETARLEASLVSQASEIHAIDASAQPTPRTS